MQVKLREYNCCSLQTFGNFRKGGVKRFKHDERHVEWLLEAVARVGGPTRGFFPSGPSLLPCSHKAEKAKQQGGRHGI